MVCLRPRIGIVQSRVYVQVKGARKGNGRLTDAASRPHGCTCGERRDVLRAYCGCCCCCCCRCLASSPLLGIAAAAAAVVLAIALVFLRVLLLLLLLQLQPLVIIIVAAAAAAAIGRRVRRGDTPGISLAHVEVGLGMPCERETCAECRRGRELRWEVRCDVMWSAWSILRRKRSALPAHAPADCRAQCTSLRPCGRFPEGHSMPRGRWSGRGWSAIACG